MTRDSSVSAKTSRSGWLPLSSQSSYLLPYILHSDIEPIALLEAKPYVVFGLQMTTTFHDCPQTSTVMAWFMLAMVTHPEIQKKAQEELDAVIGRDRMPTFADRDSLPYVQACVRESLRWKTVAPIGVPHQSVEVRSCNSMFYAMIDISLCRMTGMKVISFPREPSVFLTNGTS